ncbi:MAG: hypothetical protein KDC13_05910 [Bacteroidetes bacterium]|nr:hypothetical protein [Bacteroidota bacterium]
MLGLLLLYFIGKHFYQLAFEHNRKPWPPAILGVLAYFLGTFIYGFILAITLELGFDTHIENINRYAVEFSSIPFGILAAYGLRTIYLRHWKKSPNPDSDLLDVP